MRAYGALLVLTVLPFCATGKDAVSAVEAMEREAGAIAREFIALLKPQLRDALQAGGPAHAIGVCADVAPQLADSLSATSGWEVKRVSLKARNASRALPDAWETAALETLEQRRARGEGGETLNLGEVVGGHYRYMQAQITEPLCLVCHGTELSQPVQEALGDYYPDDQAVGYGPGEVRGGISLSRDLERQSDR